MRMPPSKSFWGISWTSAHVDLVTVGGWGTGGPSDSYVDLMYADRLRKRIYIRAGGKCSKTNPRSRTKKCGFLFLREKVEKWCISGTPKHTHPDKVWEVIFATWSARFSHPLKINLIEYFDTRNDIVVSRQKPNVDVVKEEHLCVKR